MREVHGTKDLMKELVIMNIVKEHGGVSLFVDNYTEVTKVLL